MLTSFFRQMFQRQCVGEEPNLTFLIKKMQLFWCKIDKAIHIQVIIQLSKEEYARKRICNGRSVRIENSVTRDVEQ